MLGHLIVEANQLFALNKSFQANESIALKRPAMLRSTPAPKKSPAKLSRGTRDQDPRHMQATSVQKNRPDERIVPEGFCLTKNPCKPKGRHPYVPYPPHRR
jgi:hypothetical protein